MNPNCYEPKAKFQLDEKVRRIGVEETRTVQRIVAFNGEPVIYEIQLGTDVGTRVYAREHELEPAKEDGKCPAR
jgi:hypothetical protein